MILIRRCAFEEIARFRVPAKRERSEVVDRKGTQWFAAEVENELVGCGAAEVQGKTGRIRGTFVAPEHRGQGISKLLNHACLQWLRGQVPKVTAFVTMERNLAWYVKNGFEVERQHNGIAFVRRTF